MALKGGSSRHFHVFHTVLILEFWATHLKGLNFKTINKSTIITILYCKIIPTMSTEAVHKFFVFRTPTGDSKGKFMYIVSTDIYHLRIRAGNIKNIYFKTIINPLHMHINHILMEHKFSIFNVWFNRSQLHPPICFSI